MGVYSVQSLQSTVYRVYSVQCTEFTVYSVQCTLYSVQYTELTVYSVQSLQCKQEKLNPSEYYISGIKLSSIGFCSNIFS